MYDIAFIVRKPTTVALSPITYRKMLLASFEMLEVRKFKINDELILRRFNIIGLFSSN